MSSADSPVIKVDNLNFGYGDKAVLKGVTFSLKRGSRLLLVGDNGAGKTTLLRILAGKHIHPHDSVLVLGRSSFYDTSLNRDRTYLGTDWGRRTVAFAGAGVMYASGIPVRDMMKDAQAKFPERRDMLLQLLNVDLDWKMNELSDGMRRRVQIFLQLLGPFSIILLDEITTDLDVITRKDFLDFLRRESEERGITIVYATHIFGGIDTWATHIGFLSEQRLSVFQPLDEVVKFQELRATPGIHSPLLLLVEHWLKEERASRVARLGAEEERRQRLAEEADKAKDGSSRLNSKIANGFTGGRLAYKQAVDDMEAQRAERRAARAAAAAAAAAEEE